MALELFYEVDSRIGLGIFVLAFACPVMAFEPVIQVTVANPSKPLISGNTNLPEGTPLMVNIQVAREDTANPGHIVYPRMGQGPVDVHASHFTAGPFTHHGDPYDRGTYVVSIAIASAALPNNVKPILGDMGEKMGGPNVKQSVLGPYFEIRRSFEVR